MKRVLFAIALLLPGVCVHAQTVLSQQHKEIMNEMRDNGPDAALKKVNSFLEESPDDISLLNDKLYIQFSQNDYRKAIETGKKLIVRKDVDEQSFLTLGAAYDSLNMFKESRKVYQEGLDKFPGSGLLHSQFGASLLMQNKTYEAIAIFERGIQSDPNISSNYYYLAKQYASSDPLWSILYGEVFINLESLSYRTREIRRLLPNEYTSLIKAEVLDKYLRSKNNFEKDIALTLQKYKSTLSNGVNTESLTAIKGQFIVDWYENGLNLKYPFRLFDKNRQMLKQGDFEAYNMWLFSVDNEDAFKLWAENHADQMSSFAKYQRNVVFKPLKGEYYK